MKVGIYGGSFDPVHYGHVNVAKTAVADLGLDRLVVVPAAVSPFKTGAGPGTGPWQRIEMLKAAFADVPNAVALNEDAKLVEVVRAGLVRKNAFCPCRLQKLPEFFCPCDEFKAQIADPSFHGLCHCRLYRKP